MTDDDMTLLRMAISRAENVFTPELAILVQRELRQGVDHNNPTPRDVRLAREVLSVHTPSAAWACLDCRPDSPVPAVAHLCDQHRSAACAACGHIHAGLCAVECQECPQCTSTFKTSTGKALCVLRGSHPYSDHCSSTSTVDLTWPRKERLCQCGNPDAPGLDHRYSYEGRCDGAPSPAGVWRRWVSGRR